MANQQCSTQIVVLLFKSFPPNFHGQFTIIQITYTCIFIYCTHISYFNLPSKCPKSVKIPQGVNIMKQEGVNFICGPAGRVAESEAGLGIMISISAINEMYIYQHMLYFYILYDFMIYIYICIHKYDMIPFIHVFIYIYIYRNVIKPGENLRLASKYHQPVMNLKTDLFSQTHVPERSRRRGVVVHKLSIMIFPCAIFLSAYELYKKSFRLGSDGRIPFQP